MREIHAHSEAGYARRRTGRDKGRQADATPRRARARADLLRRRMPGNLKSRSLKGVMEPFSTQGNLDMLKRAGFQDVMTIQKYVCFEGFLAIK